MSTREERLAQTEARTKVKLEAQRVRLAQVQAARREKTEKALARRQILVGKLAHDAGLFTWTDATLAGLFAALTSLGDTPNPVAVLEVLLRDGSRSPSVLEDGVAHLRWCDTSGVMVTIVQ